MSPYLSGTPRANPGIGPPNWTTPQKLTMHIYFSNTKYHLTYLKIIFLFFQEIVLKLEARSRIDQIQFLGHNFMIPKEVEIWLGDLPMASDDPELSKAMFYCLGVVSRSILFIPKNQ